MAGRIDRDPAYHLRPKLWDVYIQPRAICCRRYAFFTRKVVEEAHFISDYLCAAREAL